MLILANTFCTTHYNILKKNAQFLCVVIGIVSCKWKPSLGYLEPFLKSVTISRMDKNAL